MGPQAHPRPIIIFHDITHARAIAAAMLELAVPVDAVSAPGALRYLGGPVLKLIADEAQLGKALVDCAASSESVQLALRAGLKRILLEFPHPAFERLLGLAKAHNAELLPRTAFLAASPATLDLLRTSDPLHSCKEFLKNFPT